MHSAGIWVKELRERGGKWGIRINHGDNHHNRKEYKPTEKKNEGHTGRRDVDYEDGNNQAGRKEKKGFVAEKWENGHDLWQFVRQQALCACLPACTSFLCIGNMNPIMAKLPYPAFDHHSNKCGDDYEG